VGLLESRVNTLQKRRKFLTERAATIRAEDLKSRAQAGDVTNHHEASGEEASLSLVPSLRVRMMEEWTLRVQAAFIKCLCEKASQKATYDVKELLDRCPNLLDYHIWTYNPRFYSLH